VADSSGVLADVGWREVSYLEGREIEMEKVIVSENLVGVLGDVLKAPAMKCECSDPGCPCCEGDCDQQATYVLHRIDMDDETGTPMCESCATDAFDSGLFADVRSEDDD